MDTNTYLIKTLLLIVSIALGLVIGIWVLTAIGVSDFVRGLLTGCFIAVFYILLTLLVANKRV